MRSFLSYFRAYLDQESRDVPPVRLRPPPRARLVRLVVGLVCRVHRRASAAKRQRLAAACCRYAPGSGRQSRAESLAESANNPAGGSTVNGRAATSTRRPNVLPTTRVVAPKERPRPRVRRPQVATNRPPAPPTQEQLVTQQNEKLDSARNNIFPPVGANSYEVTHRTIESLPQGTNTTLDKVLLQLPGVTQDSAASGELHVRNEHANLQFRINGIMLPDGVAGGFGTFLDSGIIGNMSLLTGALPAQYGLRTAGVLDIQTKTDAFNNSGTVSVYGGSHQTITPFAEYGGTVGQTQYYVSGRYMYNNLGIENPTPANEAIHDRTQQEKGFLYLSTVLDPESRLTLISGAANSLIRFPTIQGSRPPLRCPRSPPSIQHSSTSGSRRPPSSTCWPTSIRQKASTTRSPTSSATTSCTSGLIRSATF